MRLQNNQQAPPAKLQPASDEQRVRRNNSQQAPPAKLQLTSDKLRIRRRNGHKLHLRSYSLRQMNKQRDARTAKQLQLASDELRARHKKSSTCRHHFQVQPLRQRQTLSTGLQHHSFGGRCRKSDARSVRQGPSLRHRLAQPQQALLHTPSIAFRHLHAKEGCRKPVLGVWRCSSAS